MPGKRNILRLSVGLLSVAIGTDQPLLPTIMSVMFCGCALPTPAMIAADQRWV
jgi:hypothetical protein